MAVAAVSLCGAGLFSVLGWFLSRLVRQQDAATAALQADVRNLRDRLATLRSDLKAHEAAHMLAGERLDRPHDWGEETSP